MSNVKFNITVSKETVDKFQETWKASGQERPEFANEIISKGLLAYIQGSSGSSDSSEVKTGENLSVSKRPLFDFYD